MNIALIILSVCLNAMAQIFLRHAMRDVDFQFAFAWFMRILLSPGIIAGFVCYAVSILIWLAVLARVQVSLAYPFQAFGYVFASTLAWALLGEQITLINAIGLAFVCIGVIILAFAHVG